MEERQVSVDGHPRPLPDPFCVIATQNPVEYEGTYPLPEAQLDRFLLKVTMPLPDRETEIRVLAAHAARLRPARPRRRRHRAGRAAPPTCARRERARSGRSAIDPAILGYIVELARATRAAPSAALGVSPRGATALLATSRAWAWLSGRDFVTPDDVQALARPTFRHRIPLRPEAELEGVTRRRRARDRARLGARPALMVAHRAARRARRARACCWPPGRRGGARVYAGVLVVAVAAPTSRWPAGSPTCGCAATPARRCGWREPARRC